MCAFFSLFNDRRFQWTRHPWLRAILRSPWLWAAIICIPLYLPALTLPLFGDDITTLEQAVAASPLQLWSAALGDATARPLLLTFWKIWLVPGRPAPAGLFHAFSLITHILNAVLVAKLTRRLLLATERGKNDFAASLTTADAGGLAAAALLATFPFATALVAQATALRHLTITAVALTAALAVLNYIEKRKLHWLALAAIACLIAPFIHESGLAVGALAAALMLSIHLRRAGLHRLWITAFLLTGASLVLLPFWMKTAEAPAALHKLDMAALGQKLLLMLQGSTFPIQGLGRLLMQIPYLSPAAVVLLLGLLWLASLIVIMARHHWLRPLGGSLAWTILAALPALIFPLGTPTDSRLVYYPAIGGVLLLATAGATVLGQLRRPLARPLILAGMVIVAGSYPALFVRQMLTLHNMALAPVWKLAAIARTRPNERHLIVNAPHTIGYQCPWYPLGEESVDVVPADIGLGRLAQLNSGRYVTITGAVFLPARAEMGPRHQYVLSEESRPLNADDLRTLILEHDRIWLTTYSAAGITLEEVGNVSLGNTVPPAEYTAVFGTGIFLLHGELVPDVDEAFVELKWKYLGPETDAAIFRHVLDCNGRILGRDDGHSLGGLLPLSFLPPGAEVRDLRRISLTTAPADWCYRLEVGLIRPDGSRLAARTPDGTALATDAAVIR